jgi:hypothetical protein
VGDCYGHPLRDALPAGFLHDDTPDVLLAGFYPVSNFPLVARRLGSEHIKHSSVLGIGGTRWRRHEHNARDQYGSQHVVSSGECAPREGADDIACNPSADVIATVKHTTANLDVGRTSAGPAPRGDSKVPHPEGCSDVFFLDQPEHVTQLAPLRGIAAIGRDFVISGGMRQGHWCFHVFQ